MRILVVLSLCIVSPFTGAIEKSLVNPVINSGRKDPTTTTPLNDIVYRPQPAILTSANQKKSEKLLVLAMPFGQRSLHSNGPAFVGNNGNHGNSPGLVLRDGMPKNARFFGTQIVHSEFTPSTYRPYFCLAFTHLSLSLSYCLLFCPQRILASLSSSNGR